MQSGFPSGCTNTAVWVHVGLEKQVEVIKQDPGGPGLESPTWGPTHILRPAQQQRHECSRVALSASPPAVLWGTCHGTAGPRLANVGKKTQREAGLWPATMPAE